MPNPTDGELIQDYLQNNNSRSLGKLWQRYQDYLYQVLFYKLSQNDSVAQDLLQDVFIKVKNNLDNGKYKEQGSAKGWLSTIARNMALDYHRSKHQIASMPFKSNLDEFGHLVDELMESPEEVIVDKEKREQNLKQLSKAIESLSKDQQDILRWRCIEGMKFEEIAEEHNMSINTALGRFRYAMLGLKKHFRLI